MWIFWMTSASLPPWPHSRYNFLFEKSCQFFVAFSIKWKMPCQLIWLLIVFHNTSKKIPPPGQPPKEIRKNNSLKRFYHIKCFISSLEKNWSQDWSWCQRHNRPKALRTNSTPLVSVLISKIFGLEKSLGIGLGRNFWSRHSVISAHPVVCQNFLSTIIDLALILQYPFSPCNIKIMKISFFIFWENYFRLLLT